MKNQITSRKLYVLAMIILSAAMINLSAQNVGEPAIDFEVTLLDGNTFKLSNQQGNVVFAFLFGNSCGPCKSVAPSVEASIYQEFKDEEGFVAVGLDVWDHSSSVSSVTGFKNATGVTFPLALLAGSVASDYGLVHDRLMVFDQNGNLAHKGTLPVSNDLDNAKEIINQLLTTVGLEGFSTRESGLKVFPQPAGDMVNFEAQGSITRIRLYDVAGRMVLEESYGAGNGSGTRTISLETIDQGVYFYLLQTGETRISGKVLIQR